MTHALSTESAFSLFLSFVYSLYIIVPGFFRYTSQISKLWISNIVDGSDVKIAYRYQELVKGYFADLPYQKSFNISFDTCLDENKRRCNNAYNIC